MAVVIRLKGLPVVAGSVDIRRFFSRLNIPDGGVHIIGGEKGEAFIIFATDEDARQAMSYSGGYIKGSCIELFLSSKTEMQSIIEINKKNLDRGGKETVTVSRRTGSHYLGASEVGSLSSLVAALKKEMDKYSCDTVDVPKGKFHASGSENTSQKIPQENYQQPRRELFNSGSLYLFIHGMPFSSTEEDVVNFFSGLQVDEVIMLKKKGRNSGDGMVKFATSNDALKGLQYNLQYMGSRFIHVKQSNEKAWINCGGRVEKHIDNPLSMEQLAHNLKRESSSSQRENTEKGPSNLASRGDTHAKSARSFIRSHSRSPSRTVMTRSRSTSRSPSRRISAQIHSQSPTRRITTQSHSRSPLRVTGRTCSRSPSMRVTGRTYSRSPSRRVTGQTRSRSPSRRVTGQTRSRSPSRKVTGQTHSRSPSRRATGRTHSRSPSRRATGQTRSLSPSRRVTGRTHSRSPRRATGRTHSRSPSRRVTGQTRSRSPSRKVTGRTRSRSLSRRVTGRTHSRSPSKRATGRTHSRSPSRTITAFTHSRSPLKKTVVQTHSRSSSKRATRHSHSPFSGSTHSLSSHNREYYVQVQNLSTAVQKDDLRLFFGELDISDDQIVFLKPHSRRERDAIVIFKSRRVYEAALACHKCRLYEQRVHLFPVPKTKAFQLMRSSETTRSPERHDYKRGGNDPERHSESYTCLYVRNFPYDVTNVEVQKFFAGFSIDERDIHLLYDDKGVGLGEALVKFKSEEQARKAESLNHRQFLGTEVLLRCISEKQMREFAPNVSSVVKKKIPGHHHSDKKCEHFCPVSSQGPSMHGNLKHPLDYKHPADDLKHPSDHYDSKFLSDYRHPSGDLICSSDHFRSPPTFTGFGESTPGTFPGGYFAPDSNFRGGSHNITVIKLQNLPFRVSHNEILDFFHGYGIIPESLSLQQNEYGMFSGEALIALINYEEAVAAITELSDRPIGKRKIRLTFM